MADEQLVVALPLESQTQGRLAPADVDEAPPAPASPRADLAAAGDREARRAQAAGGGQAVDTTSALTTAERGTTWSPKRPAIRLARERRTVSASSDTWIEVIGASVVRVGATCPARPRR